MKYNKIHIYNRHFSRNRKHPQRPNWFDYDKCFGNLLATTNFDLCDLTVIFEKEEDYDNYFIKKYEKYKSFKVKFVDTNKDKWADKNLSEDKAWCRSIAAASEVIKSDDLSQDDLIYISDDDFLHIPSWGEVCVDYANNFLEGDNWWICPCDYGDKYFFIDKNHRIDEYGTDQGMYAELTSKIRPSSYRHWRQVPNCMTSSIMPVKTFNRDYDQYWAKGYSDCSLNSEIGKKYGTEFWTPIPSLSCHAIHPFMPPLFNWKSVMEDVRINAG
jgi:hypothetical protein